MYIRSTNFIRFSEGKSVEMMDIYVASASELPSVDYFEGRLIAEGSIAWDISTGTFYGFANNTWYAQNGSDASASDNS